MLANELNAAWTGRGNLRQLLGELERQRDSRVDFVADTRQLRICSPTLEGGGRGPIRLVPSGQTREWLPLEGVTISDHALAQIADVTEPAIPVKYVRALAAGKPEIAAQLINQTGTGKRRLIRVLDGRLRAFLSDTYRIMDNYDLAFSALEVAKNAGANVLECSLTDSHMRIKLVTDSIWETIDNRQQHGGGAHEWITGAEADPRYRDAVGFAGTGQPLRADDGGTGVINPVVTISNSETGQGGLNVRIGIFERYCLNTCLIDTSVREIHLGRRLTDGIFSAETRDADAKAMSLACRDAITAAFTPAGFAKLVAKVKAAKAAAILAPSGAVGLLVDTGLVPESKRDSLLEHFLGSYDRNAWGLAQAVSRMSQEIDDPNVASEFELVSGKIVENPADYAVAR